ncbi:MAG: helix-turn-helix domain-containing protein [Sulfitobacter sp.]|nr:helix-turn-helix domain-containing protein [Sulfitobacter sp.]
MLTYLNDIQIRSLAQFTQGQDWQLQLAHDRPYHLLIWITRGQGVGLLDGLRRGIGAHNAIFVPAGSLFSLTLGRQSTGQVMMIPDGGNLRLPEIPRLLRIREVQAQGQLSGLIDAAAREEQMQQPLYRDALESQAALISVWLRRQIMLEDHVPERRNAAGRLSKKFCESLSERYRKGEVMADYAAALGVTPTHLSRAVKSATGKTAADLLTERILHAARSLLLETDVTAQSIARFLGFGSAAYFTRFVQQHTGQTPSKLRKR